ncbi:hypothetical protein PILCRDRAFT_91119 [Piloderma croceum F 1598]|uniref:Uncharacterized protein n=1 Tax=Piloderma croceum (strain F 1598) TaxID=765440 RepID=A0A0C3EXW0_PILCF|nr:hypothetical protein PILCRDRAFT_91119 [Piloderma croceum F 1598]
MPKHKWTTDEQHDWLSSRMPDFVAAQEKKPSSMKPFFGPIYVDWFKIFPCPEPTVKKLAEAKGAGDVAKATLETKMKSRIYYWFFNHMAHGSTSTTRVNSKIPSMKDTRSIWRKL